MFGHHQKIAMRKVTIPCVTKTQPVSSETVAEVQLQLAWDKFSTERHDCAVKHAHCRSVPFYLQVHFLDKA